MQKNGKKALGFFGGLKIILPSSCTAAQCNLLRVEYPQLPIRRHAPEVVLARVAASHCLGLTWLSNNWKRYLCMNLVSFYP